MLTISTQHPVQMDPLRQHSHMRLSDDASARQYAIPANRSFSDHQRQKVSGLSYVEHELLRQRKTPHGRVLEQEFPVVDKYTQIPASKHVLLSSSPGLHSGMLAYRDSPHQRLPPIPTNRSSGLLNYDGRDSRHGFVQTGQIPSWDFPGGLDSVLNQSLPLQPSHRYYLQQGSKVPTVLPATLHSAWGPTASAGQDSYGPYWPDGTFSPYRPASIRDSRYFNRLEGVWDPRHSLSSVPVSFPQLRRSSKPITNLQNTVPAPLGSVAEAYNTLTPTVREVSGKIFHQPDHLKQKQVHLLHQPQVPSCHQPQVLSTPPLRPSLESEQVAFRDRTFMWANRVYTQLLTTVQRTSNHSQHSENVADQIRTVHKPAIYPRPPKRSGSHFGEDSMRFDDNRKTTARDEHHDSLRGSRRGDASRPQTAIYAPSQTTFEEQMPLAIGANSNPFQVTRTLSAKAGCQNISLSGTQLPLALQPTPAIHDAATSALSTMELLCEEAKAPWIDGMLLAGCLAYGLGNYVKALSWYQNILAKDSTHVEAMSNLAATLMALNQRSEAARYWSAAVKLRPSYFEAVEHLIGLLCSTRRTKEAVELIEFVEASLKIRTDDCSGNPGDILSDAESDTRSHSSSVATTSSTERPQYDFEMDTHISFATIPNEQRETGFGNSGYNIAAAENGRMLALIHAKGNMLYALGNNNGAAAAFEDAILIATGQRMFGIRGLISNILSACVRGCTGYDELQSKLDDKEPLLLAPDQAEATAKNMFSPSGELPGLEFVPQGMATRAAISTTSNSLLSLAKIYQDSMSNASEYGRLRTASTRDILALYYLSLSLQRSPSTANNVGILLAGVQQSVKLPQLSNLARHQICNVPGVVPGSGISLALLYYNYGLNLDPTHAHLYTNLGSLLKDIGQLNAAIKMYEMAVSCDGTFDIALANLANAVKDQGRVADAISYYRRAVQANADFAEAVCGLATALNSVCSWHGRGGIYADGGRRDRIHVNDQGMMHDAGRPYGWINRVVEIVEKQLRDGETWGVGILTPTVIDSLCQQLTQHQKQGTGDELARSLGQSLRSWAGKNWEGSRLVRLVERAIRHIGWSWYQDRYKHGKEYPLSKYVRPTLPGSLSSPSAPTILPFHTFTAPLSAKQVRQISQRNALRISVSTLRSAWLPKTVFPPPPPPNPALVVGYISSDFNNHPLAHLMQSVFGLHDPSRVHAICYATTSTDGSIHRQQIEREAPAFHDAASWTVEKLVKQITEDGVHVLVNLNGYTRGARNEVFAARPAPIQMSFMGFAGTLGAEWCDYVFADSISVPPETLSPWRRNVDLNDKLQYDALVEDAEDWVYSENVIFARDTFFCVDHKQSAPDVQRGPPSFGDPEKLNSAWKEEQARRWQLRQELFPMLSDSAVILGNFNQLYKIDPATFRTYLRILAAVSNTILWLLRFPDLGERNLLTYANGWAGPEIASRILFTDVAPKGMHITRASVVDLFLDTPECNAHTTAADVVWSGTPIITWGKWKYKMCSRMASSIVSSAFPETKDGDDARKQLIVHSEEQYEREAIKLARGLKYASASQGHDPGSGSGRLMELRRTLWEGRWSSRLFDTQRWVREIEQAYWEAWKKWEKGEGGDIWL